MMQVMLVQLELVRMWMIPVCVGSALAWRAVGVLGRGGSCCRCADGDEGSLGEAMVKTTTSKVRPGTA